MNNTETLQNNPLYQIGSKLIPDGLAESDFSKAWPDLADEPVLFAGVTPAHLEEIEQALNVSDLLKPKFAWALLVVRAARAMELRRECTRYLARFLASVNAALDDVADDVAAAPSRQLTDIYERVEAFLDPSDTETYESVMRQAARAYESSGTDSARLERAVNLLESIQGSQRGRAQVDLSHVALSLWRVTEDERWRLAAVRAADQALQWLDAATDPDWYARALHERGYARALSEPAAQDIAASVKDLNAAYEIWRDKGSPRDRWMNRMALARTYGLGFGGHGTAITADAVAAAMDCYREALKIVRSEYPTGGWTLLHEVHKFLQRMFAGPLPSRLAILQIAWDHLPDSLLEALEQNDLRFEEVHSHSRWTPRAGIPRDWNVSTDAVPADVSDAIRYLLVRPEYAWANLALELVNHGFAGRAVAQLESHLEKHSDDADATYQLGVLYFYMRQPVEAQACFTRALQLRPDWKVLKDLLAGL